MYQSTFGITAPPFQLTADPSFYFDSSTHRQALGKLRSWLLGEQRLIVVTGETGVGKTTIVRTAASEVDAAVIALANIVSTQLDAEDLLSAAWIAFGRAEGSARDSPPDDIAESLLRFLLGVAEEGRRAVLIIDEAQNIPASAFDRLLAFATQKVPRAAALQVWLIGHPELREMLKAADCPVLRSLPPAMCHLGPLSREETGAYIEHRLAKVGWNGSPRFEPGAFDEIFRWTQGVPRRIHQLCNRLLMARSLDARLIIDVASVNSLAAELNAEIGPEGHHPPRGALPASSRERGAPGPANGLQVPHLLDAIPRVDVELELSAVTLAPAASRTAATFLCVAANYGDHVKAAAFIRAVAVRADASPPASLRATLLRVHDNDSLAYCGRLYADLDAGRHKVDLNVSEGAPDAIVVELMTSFEAAVDRLRPGAVVVFDGSPTAFACSTVARAKRIPIVHVGAGLRVDDSFVALAATRKLTDHLADVLFTTDAQASRTLGEEGMSPERVHCVGNLAMDALQFAVELRAPATTAFENRHGYALVVLSNPLNIDSRDPLGQLTEMLSEVSRVIPLVWLMRSRLHVQLKKYHLGVYIPKERVRRLPAQTYVDYVALLRGATCVLTDSWSVQEEASALSIPCLAIGVFPERAIPGGSVLPVGLSRTRAVSAVWEYVLSGLGRGDVPPLWDGRTGARIAGYLAAWNAAAASTQ